MIQSIAVFADHDDVIEDNYIKPYAEGYYKKILPVRIQMKVMGGRSPEILFFSNWKIIFDNKDVEITPELFANNDDFISQDDWKNLLKPASKIDINNFAYKKLPEAPPQAGQITNYLLYSSYKSLKVDVFGFSTTSYIRNDSGVMVFIRGNGVPKLDDGWVVLGRTYAEVWSDPDKLRLYNSIYPPDKDGKPKPFELFAGAEKEMLGQ